LVLIAGLLGFEGFSGTAFADDVVLIATTILPVGQTGVPYAAPVVPGDGAAPFRFYIVSGSLPSGLSLNSGNGWISGTPGSTGRFYFTAGITDEEGFSASANLYIDVNSTSNSANVPTYGAGMGSDGLANTTIGPWGNEVSYRFRATHTGVLQQATVYLITDVGGYSGGNGGTLRVDIRTDDGTSAHNPSGNVLTTYFISNAASLPAPQRYIYVMNFTNTPTLNAGQIYHMTFQNVDSNPSNNFISVDSLYEATPQSSFPPAPSDPYAAVLIASSGGSWSPRDGFAPVYELDYQDGASEGIGYVASWVGVPASISGSVPLRETFTVTGSQTRVASAAVRVARVRGEAPVVIRFEEADGTLVEEGYIDASNIPLSSVSSPNYYWASFNFSESHALVPGVSYHLVVECDANSTYQAVALQKGHYYGLQSTTFFADGNAEVKVNDSWTGWTEWGVSNRIDDDLQFYFGIEQ
jgi:hypothetical protein